MTDLTWVDSNKQILIMGVIPASCKVQHFFMQQACLDKGYEVPVVTWSCFKLCEHGKPHVALPSTKLTACCLDVRQRCHTKSAQAHTGGPPVSQHLGNKQLD